VTNPFTVAAIVEGHGKVEALPVLLRRLVMAIDPNRYADVRKPIRVGGIPMSVILPVKEFEAWFLAAAVSPCRRPFRLKELRQALA
jgi:hypothetical protein